MTVTVTSEQMEQQITKFVCQPRSNELLNQLLKPEVQESLTTLVEQLPKLTSCKYFN